MSAGREYGAFVERQSNGLLVLCMIDTIGPLIYAGALMGAGGEFGAFVEWPSNGFDCDVGGEEFGD